MKKMFSITNYLAVTFLVEISSLSNNGAGWNKSAGLLIPENLILMQDVINVQVGKFLEFDEWH